MIVDIILDRKDGAKYSQKAFLDYAINGEYESIAKALMSNDEQLIKKTLKEYLDGNMFNPMLSEYIDSVNWVDGEGVEPVKMKERWTVAWDNYMGEGRVVRWWVRDSVSDADLEDKLHSVVCHTERDADMLLAWHYAD